MPRLTGPLQPSRCAWEPQARIWDSPSCSPWQTSRAREFSEGRRGGASFQVNTVLVLSSSLLSSRIVLCNSIPGLLPPLNPTDARDSHGW